MCSFCNDVGSGSDVVLTSKQISDFAVPHGCIIINEATQWLKGKAATEKKKKTSLKVTAIYIFPDDFI